MTANSTPSESADNSVVEVDGVLFETLVSDSILPTPENKPGYETLVKLGIRITNNSHKPRRFCLYDTVFPDLIEPNGTHLKLEGGRDRSRLLRESDCPLINPARDVTFFLSGRLIWKNNQLQIEGADGFGGLWRFETLKPGMYHFRFSYYSSQELIQISYPEKKVLENIWIGKVHTPISEVSLVLS